MTTWKPDFKQFLTTAALVILSCVLPVFKVSAEEESSSNSPEKALRTLQTRLLPGHPLVRAGIHRLEQARMGVEGVDGYYDPELRIASGGERWNRALPGTSLGAGLRADSIGIEVGVEWAVEPGVILGAGIAERYLYEIGDEGREAWQTLAGLQASVPLLRNRGHAGYHAEQRKATWDAAEARHALTAVLQNLRLITDLAYIELLKSAADAEAYRSARQRVEALVEETIERVRLNDIPEYQIYPSRMDAALRKEELVSAEQRIESARLRLVTLLGESPPIPGVQALLEWAEQSAAEQHPAPPHKEREALLGAVASGTARIEAARSVEDRLQDELKPDLRLHLGLKYQVEDYDNLFGGTAISDEKEVGYEAALVLTVPWGRRTEKASLKASQAAVLVEQTHLEEERNQWLERRREADSALNAARQRMALVGEAVVSARRTLEAEAERFKLGEGRSRNVLDAQKDLTAAELQRNAASAALLRAVAALDAATAYPRGLLPGHENVPQAQELLRLCQDEESP